MRIYITQCTAVMAAMALATGCRDEPTPTSVTAEGPQLVTFGNFSVPSHQIARSTRAVTIDVPRELPAWFLSDEALVDAVRRADGRVLIGLKPPDTPHSLEAGGVRTSIPGGELATPLREFSELGLEDGVLIGDLGILAGSIAPDIAPTIRKYAWVDFIEPNATLEFLGSSTPAPIAATLRAQTIPWGVSKVGANTVWSVSTGNGASVMIIDGGFDDGHEDLVDVDPSHCFGNFGGCSDGSGHGTHVLGDLMARNNALGYVGVAPGVAASDLYSWGACDAGGSCSFEEATAGAYKADTLGVDILNMSLGTIEYPASLMTAVTAAISGGVLAVAAGGKNTDSTFVWWPAAGQYVIGVSGVNEDLSFASSSPCGSSSGYGSYIDVAAPYWSYNAEPGDTYAPGCGTSFATPHVSGVAALIKAEWPSFDNFAIRARIRGTATDLGPSGYDQRFGHGFVNASTALGPWPNIEGETFVAPNQQCRWEAQVSGGYGAITEDWHVNGFYEHTGHNLWWNVGSEDFTINLKATDGQGVVRWSSTWWITVSPSGVFCPE